MKPKTPEELIRYAATEIMGWHMDLMGNHWWLNDSQQCTTEHWNPLSDAGAYQLEMIEAELVKLGFYFEHGFKDYYWIGITHSHMDISAYNSWSDDTKTRLNRLTEMCSAHEKYLEVGK